MRGALARGLLRRGKPLTGLCSADPTRNLSPILLSHPKGAVHTRSRLTGCNYRSGLFEPQ